MLGLLILMAMSIPTLISFRSSKTLNISFVCLTNSQYFGPVAAFCAANKGDRCCCQQPTYSPLSKIHGTWSQPTEQYLDIEGDVGPHQFVQFVVPIVTNQTPWRVVAKWHYATGPHSKTLWIWAGDRLPSSWQRFLKIKRVNLFEDTAGPTYESYSTVMTNN